MARTALIPLAAASVALGLATTIGVAWAIPFGLQSLDRVGPGSAFSNGVEVLPFQLWRGGGFEWAYRTSRGPIPINDTDDMADGYQYAGYGIGYVNYSGPAPAKRWKSLGPVPSHVPSPEPAWSQAFEPMRYQYAAGWPRPCLYCDWVTEDEPRFSLNPVSQRGTLFALAGRHPLPAYPLWRNLFANAAVHAGGWGLLIGAIPAGRVLRRRCRRRLGRCSRCGYDLLGIVTACPECGLPCPGSGSGVPEGSAGLG